MQLGEARSRIAFDHGFGPLHRLVCRQMLPRIGAKMIASEDHSGRVKTYMHRDVFHGLAEIGGRHAGVAALLVDLIAGRLDENALARTKRKRQGRFDGDGMGGANRCDAGSPAGQPFAYQRRERSSHGAGSFEWLAMKASSSAWLAAPSIGPCRVTAKAPLAAA
jgi:hypothetical protein